MSGDVNFQGTNEEWTEFVKRIKKEKKRLLTEIIEDDAKDGLYHIVDTNKMVTAIEWLEEQIKITYDKEHRLPIAYILFIIEKAKAMEKEQCGYSKEDVLKAGEIGEINHHDYKHIVSLLDEAREINNKL